MNPGSIFSKENEELERKYIPPDYSEAKDDEDDEDEEIDDDIEIDDIEEDDDPAEDEEILEIRETLPETSDDLPFKDTTEPPSKPVFQQTSSFQQPKPFNNPYANPQPQRTMNSWTPPGTQPSGGQMPWSGQSSWNPKPATPSWNPGGVNTSGWGIKQTPSQNALTLDRTKRVILCDVMDCLVCTEAGPSQPGLVPRGPWDIFNRLDVWKSFRRFSYIERVYAMIPKDFVPKNTSRGWIACLDNVALSLADFLHIPDQAVQIISPSFIAQPKEDMVSVIIDGIPKESIVYIGTQSGFQGQSSIDFDTATALGIDYIDLQNFLLQYS